MSIYATLWAIQVEADDRWATVYAQGVPPHIGQTSEGYTTDPYDGFLPPVVTPYDPADPAMPMRAVVIVSEGHEKKDGQRYEQPLLVLSGEEYARIPFGALLARIRLGLKEILDDTQVSR